MMLVVLSISVLAADPFNKQQPSATPVSSINGCADVFGLSNPKVVVIGASNSVDGNKWPKLLSNICSDLNIQTLAVAGNTPSIQNKEQLPKALALNPDMVIISPSGNGISSLSTHQSNVEDMIKAIKNKNSNTKVVVLSVAPRKGYNYCSSSDPNCPYKWTTVIQANVDSFNDNLLNNNLGLGNLIDYTINLDIALEDPSNLDYCAFCANDGGHWTDVGQNRVTQLIYQKIFFGQTPTFSSLPDSAQSSISTPVTPSTTTTTTTGTTTTKKVDKIVADCLSTQTCKEIDEVWSTRASLALGGSGKVWDTTSNDWNIFDNVYYEIVQVAGDGTTTPVGTTPTTTGGVAQTSSGMTVSCTASVGTLEQRALIDAIAWAEGATAQYNIMVGGGTFSDYSGHPVDTGEMPSSGIYIDRLNNYSTAAGRYQFLYSNYNGLKTKGLFSTGFNPEEQDRAALSLVVDKRGVTQSDLETAVTSNNFVPVFDKLALEWASLPYSAKPGQGYYGQGSKPASTIIEVFNACLNAHKNPASAITGNAIFPIQQGSYDLIKYDWGNSRTLTKSDGSKVANGRCHAGIDIETKSPGNVVAVADGVITNVIHNWYTCSDGWGLPVSNGKKIPQPIDAVLVYHPSLGKTITYGEIDNDHLGTNIVTGAMVKQGQLIGRAGYCGVLHFELYQGSVDTTKQWIPTNGQLVTSPNQCRSDYLATKPAELLDPTSLLQQLESKGGSTSTSTPTASVTTTSAGTKLVNYVSNCNIASTSTADKNNLIVIPASVTANPDVYFYFRGLRNTPATETGQSLRDYVNGPTNFLTSIESTSKNSVFVLFKEPQGHNSSANDAWMDDKFANCFASEALEVLSSQGITSTSSLNLAAHSGGGKAISEILSNNNQGLSLNNILLFDACYGNWCQTIVNNLNKFSVNQMSVFYNKLAGFDTAGKDYSNPDVSDDEDKNTMVLISKNIGNSKLQPINVGTSTTRHNAMVGSCLFYNQGLPSDCIQ